MRVDSQDEITCRVLKTESEINKMTDRYFHEVSMKKARCKQITQYNPIFVRQTLTE